MKKIVLSFLAIFALFLAGNSFATLGGNVQIANPASQFCEEVGGVSQIETKGDGSQYGTCSFDDGRICEEWALFRKECQIGGRKVTGYITPEARYCAITGNEYIYKSGTTENDEKGDCKLQSGEIVDAKDFYEGKIADDSNSSENEYDDNLICTMEYFPVCGQDGKTYGNACMAQNVGVKYVGECLNSSSETKLNSAFDKFFDSKITSFSLGNQANILQNGILNVDKKIADGKISDTETFRIYNYFKYVFGKALQDKVFGSFISENILKISPVAPDRNGNFIVTELDWKDLNTAKVTYEDGHFIRFLNVFVFLDDNKNINVSPLQKMDYVYEFNNEKVVLRFDLPTSWEGNYEIENLGENVIRFNFLPKGNEQKTMIFNFLVFTNEGWQKQIEEGLFNITYRTNIGNYVIASSDSLDMPFTNSENIQNYSKMISEVSVILDSVE